jgi:hypothetical protein
MGDGGSGGVMSRKKKETTQAAAAPAAAPVPKPVYAVPAGALAGMPRAASPVLAFASPRSSSDASPGARVDGSPPAHKNGANGTNGHAHVTGDQEVQALRDALMQTRRELEASRREIDTIKASPTAAATPSPTPAAPAAHEPPSSAQWAPGASENARGEWAKEGSRAVYEKWRKGRHGETVPQHESHLCALWEWVLAPRHSDAHGLEAPPAACTIQVRSVEGGARPYDLEIAGEAVTHTNEAGFSPRRALMGWLERNRRYPNAAEHFVGRIFARRGDGGEEDLGTGDVWIPPVPQQQPSAPPPTGTGNPYAPQVPWQNNPAAPPSTWGAPPWNPYAAYPPPPWASPWAAPYGWGGAPPWAQAAAAPPEAIKNDPALVEIWRAMTTSNTEMAKMMFSSQNNGGKSSDFLEKLTLTLLAKTNEAKSDSELETFMKAIDLVDRLRGGRDDNRPLSERLVDVGDGTKIFMDRKGDPDGLTSLAINGAKAVGKLAERMAARSAAANARPLEAGAGGMPRAK